LIKVEERGQQRHNDRSAQVLKTRSTVKRKGGIKKKKESDGK